MCGESFCSRECLKVQCDQGHKNICETVLENNPLVHHVTTAEMFVRFPKTTWQRSIWGWAQGDIVHISGCTGTFASWNGRSGIVERFNNDRSQSNPPFGTFSVMLDKTAKHPKPIRAILKIENMKHPANLHSCDYCGASVPKTQMNGRCGGCKDVNYCNRMCQKNGYPLHKIICKELQLNRKARKKETKMTTKAEEKGHDIWDEIVNTVSNDKEFIA